MKTIAIVNQKGGVGKTTTAAAIGSGLVNQHKKVLFLDLDAQCSLSYLMQADYSGKEPCAMDLMQGTAAAADAVQVTMQGHVIAACPALAIADTMITDTGKEYRIREALEPIAAQYDYCIIDTPPALGVLVINALAAADGCIIPAQADLFSLQGIAQLKKTIQRVTKYCNPGLTVYGIVLTRYADRTLISREVSAQMEELANIMQTKLYNTRIRECTAIKTAQYLREPIFTHAPRSNASKDYAALIDEIQKGEA